MKPSCIICTSTRLPSLKLMVVAFRENQVLKSCLCLLPSPQPCHGSLIRKVLATWLFGLSSMKMAGPLRGHAWPGDVPAPPSSQWQDLCRSIIVAASPLTSHFHVLSVTDFCYALRRSLMTKMYSPQGRGLAPLPRSSAPLPRNLHTPHPLPPCVTPIHGADCLYLPLGCLVKESFPLVCPAKCWGEMTGQSGLHVWPVLLWVARPHFISAFNLRGASAMLFDSLWGHPKL